MEVFEGKVRQVGSSFGVLIPKSVVKNDNIKKNQTVKVVIMKKDLSLLEKAFGSVKTKPFKRDHQDRVVWLLLDTYAWVEFFNATEKGAKVKEFLKNNPCFTSAISIAELSEWIEKEKLDRQKKLFEIKNLSTILEVDQEILELAGMLKVKKRETEKNFGMIDAIILATAKQYHLKIVTGDKHFAGENAILL